MKRSRRVLCGALAMLTAVSVLLNSGALRPEQAYAVTISDLEGEAAEHQEKLDQINKQLKEAQAQQASALEQKELLDQQAEVLRSQIENAQSQIAALEADLQENEAKEQKQYELFCKQVRDEEERGVASFWSVLFKAVDFSDLLGRVDFINEVAEYDKSVISDLRALRQQLQDDKSKLEQQQSELTQRQEELSAQLEAATQLVAQYAASADGLSDAADAEKAAADAVNRQIENMRNQNSSGGSSSGGNSSVTPSADGYIWPSDARYITSGYGGREQPTPGASTNHMGVDIGASYGTNIYATKSGTVIVANLGWGGGYGNYVQLDHGNGNYTLYAHMSALAVSTGDYVSQGQVIGYCGSTGVSTGPHVHYEIWENYARINPLNRLPGYIPWWD